MDATTNPPPFSFVDMLGNPEEFDLGAKNFDWVRNQSFRPEEVPNHEFLPFLPNPELDMNMWYVLR